MRVSIMIAAFAAVAMLALAHTASTADRVIGAADCTADCPTQEAAAAETSNGVGTNLPNDPTNYDDDDN
jgi:hypothetical protein